MDFHRTFKEERYESQTRKLTCGSFPTQEGTGAPAASHQKERNQELTQEERLLQHYQEQISQMHESNFQQELQAKLDSGQELTPEEEQYLEKSIRMP